MLKTTYKKILTGCCVKLRKLNMMAFNSRLVMRLCNQLLIENDH